RSRLVGEIAAYNVGPEYAKGRDRIRSHNRLPGLSANTVADEFHAAIEHGDVDSARVRCLRQEGITGTCLRLLLIGFVPVCGGEEIWWSPGCGQSVIRVVPDFACKVIVGRCRGACPRGEKGPIRPQIPARADACGGIYVGGPGTAW